VFAKINAEREEHMSAVIVTDELHRAIRFVTTVYARLLLAGFALVPAYLIAYLYFFQDPTLTFENHAFHEMAIAAATLEGLFVTYVTWRCYRSSGEPLLRWMTRSFLGFVLVYALHGAFTGLAHHNMWLFLLYGPASRLVMAILLFVALLSYDRPPDAAERHMKPRTWLAWIGLFLLVDLVVAYIATSPIAGYLAVRLSMEGGALVFSRIECDGVAAAPYPFAANDDFRHLGHGVCALVSRVHPRASVEPHVVARACDFCWRVFPTELRRCAGVPDHAVVLDDTQPGGADGAARRGGGHVPSVRFWK
jgi:hypothetical protein